MKKSLFFVATAALVLASCSNDVKIDENTVPVGSNVQQEISFSTMAKRPKRAHGAAESNVVEGVTFPENYNMKVVAYAVPKTGSAGNYFGNADADGGILFEYKNAGVGTGFWGGSPAQYWPLAHATINFLAVSEGNASPLDAVVSPQFNSTNYANEVTVTLGDNKPQSTGDSLQHDLMYAFGRDSVVQAGNVLTFPTKVDMEFNHALAWVYFRAKAGNDASKAIAIKDIKLNGANYGGTFKATLKNYDKGTVANALAWDDDETKWTAVSNNSNNIASPNVKRDTIGALGSETHTKINTASFTRIGAGILVVPTADLDATNSITSFDIVYSLNGVEYTYNYVPAVLKYEKGKKYMYDITMNLHEIFVNASVAGWEEGDTTHIDVPARSIAYNEGGGALTLGADPGYYTFIITGVPAAGGSTYSFEEADAASDNLDFIDGAVTINENTTASAEGYIRLTLKSTGGAAGKKHLLKLKLGNDPKMTITLTL